MVGRKEGGRRGRQEERGRVRERMSLGAKVTRKNSSRTQSPSGKSIHAGEGTCTMRLCMNMQFIYGTVTVLYPTHKYEVKNNNTKRENIYRV